MVTTERQRMATVCAAVPPKIQSFIYEEATRKQISPSELIRRILSDYFEHDKDKLVITTTGG